ncbi:MAG: T9SS type A sorting domain-containing protein [Bacteroidota bacterium]
MKKIFFSLVAIMSFLGLSAQNQQDDGKVTMIKSEFTGISRPLRDLFEEKVPNQSTNFIEHDGMFESKDREGRIPQTFVPINEIDPVIQSEPGTYQAKTLINWAGQSDGSCPPDPTGACGTNYYVQMVNATPIKVFNKTTGAQVGTVKQLGSLWGSNTNEGDPIVLYDKFADRWFLSQFQSSGNKTNIAISTTNDPTGTYYTYQFTNASFPDYQKFSVWQDGYYMTSNQSNQNVYVFQRSVMLTGGTPKAFYKTFSPSVGTGFFCPLPADADGTLPPAGTPCPVFSYEDNGWGGSHTDAINVYSFTVDWSPATPTATVASQHLASAAFDASYNSSWNDISQYGSTQMLDGIGGVCTFRAQHRVWTGYNSVVLCMGVKTGVGTQRSIRWYELRNTGGTWSIYQQSTYAPADGLNRWVGSIAMDDNGSIGMAFSVTGSGGTGGNVYPSLAYTGRRATDPLGTMTFAETIAQTGTGAITGCSNRFGDYSHTSLDPSDGVTFWHTGEYGSSSGSGGYGTRIFTFQIPTNVGINESKVQNTPGLTVYQSGSDLNVKANNLPSNNQMVVDLFDINGQIIKGKIIAPTTNAFETSLNVTGLAAGTYLVRVGEPNTAFQKVTKVVIE